MGGSQSPLTPTLNLLFNSHAPFTHHPQPHTQPHTCTWPCPPCSQAELGPQVQRRLKICRDTGMTRSGSASARSLRPAAVVSASAHQDHDGHNGCPVTGLGTITQCVTYSCASVSSFVKCRLSPPAKVLVRTLSELENAGLRVLAGCVNPCWLSCSAPDWASGFSSCLPTGHRLGWG